MRFTKTVLPGLWLIDIEPLTDERGFFARTNCVEEMSAHGLNGRFLQQSVSWNPRRGTLRGLHYQSKPFGEDKLVRVTRGAIFDVVADLRADSPTFGQWLGMELSADNYRQLFIPRGMAHGFQTLLDGTEVFYEMTLPHHGLAACGVAWNDPDLDISWPHPDLAVQPGAMSAKDKTWPSLQMTDRQ